MSRRKTCKRQGCSKPLPPIAVSHGDPSAQQLADRVRDALNDLYHYTADAVGGIPRRLAPGRSQMHEEGIKALAALVARVEQAERERDEARRHANKLGREIDEQGDELERAEADNQRLREALREYADEGNEAHDTGCLRHPMHWPDENDGKPGFEREVGGPGAPCSCRYAVARAALASAPQETKEDA